MSNKILVTGGAGFIGSFLVDKLISLGHDVTIFDNLEPQVHPDSQMPDYINKSATFVRGDVSQDSNDLKDLVCNSDIIYHEAAMVGVGQSMYQVGRYVNVNTLGTAKLLDLLANSNHNVKKLVVAASMSSYGEGVYLNNSGERIRPSLRTSEQMSKHQWEITDPTTGDALKPVGITEEDAQNCNSVYAITKKDQEDLVMNVCGAYGIPATALRYFNVFGPRQSLSNPYTGVAAIFMSRIKNDHAPLVFEDGLQSRDFVSVHDIVQANLLAMTNRSSDGEVFNVGAGRQISILDIAEILAKLYGKDIKPEIVGKFRKGDVRHCFSDISKIKSKLEYEPKVSFEDGMKELISWAATAESKDLVDDATKELKEKGLLE